MSDTINRHSNNFDFLRLVGALSVIFFTTFGVMGAYMSDPIFRLTKGAFTSGTLGVIIFFIISGYLITMSWDKRRSITRFIWARFLRIVPALAALALFTVFIIGPLTTHQNLWDYFTSRDTWGYFSIVTVFFPSYSLPGVFTHNPISKVNGALWSLPVESIMYMVILALGALGVIYKKSLVTLATLAVLGAYLFINLPTVHLILPIIPYNVLNPLRLYSQALVYPLYFMIGSLYYLHGRKIKFDLRLVLLAAIAWLLSIWSFDMLLFTSLICIPYIVMGIAFAGIPYVNMVGKKADISYGLYIFHYPVQQTLVNFVNIDPLTLFVVTLLITVPLAWLSWRLIESRALGLKDININTFGIRRKTVPEKSTG